MSKFHTKVTHFFVILSLMIGVFAVSKNPVAFAAVGINRQVNYQGRLLSSAGVPVSDGAYNIKFSIYAASSGGTPLWTSAGTVGSPTGTAVTVTNGLFSIQLGDTGSGQNAFDLDWNQSSLFLGVTINSDTEMSPRKRLTAVPYAFVAETLQGQYASSSVASSGGTLFNLRQQSADAASGDRTALYISTSGTSNALDFLIKASNGSEVFTVSRQGNVTTTGNIATNGNAIIGDASTDALIVNARLNSDIMPFSDNAFVLGTSSLRWRGIDVVNATTTYSTTTNLAVSTYARLPSDTRINNTTVCLSDGTNCATASEVDTLLSITNRGSVATSSVTFFGGLITSDLTATGTTSLQNTTFANATATNVTSTSVYATTLGSGVANITSLNFVSATGTDIRAASGTFTNLTMGSASATVLFATNLSFANGTSTSSFLFNNASGSSLSIQGQSVCLANGVNCQVVSLNDMNWTYSLASDLVRNTTSTTDIILGGAATATAPVFFSLTGENASSNRLIVGQNQNMDVTIGNSTSSGLNAAFQLSGNDLYVEGNIGSVTSVYTNGAFIAGSGSTMYGDGFLTKTNGLFTLSSTAGNLQLQTITSGNIVLDPVNGGTGTTTFGGTTSDRLVFTARADSDLLPAADSAYSLGSPSLRWLGLQATNVTSTSIVTDTLLVNTSITVSTTVPTVVRAIRNTSRIDEPQGNVVVSGKYAYVTSNASNNGRLAVVDISNPSSATTVGSLAGLTGLQNIAIAGKYAYATKGSGGGGLSVIDISSSSNPGVVASLTGLGPDDIAVSGKFAYVSCDTAPQFRTIDIASSTAPFVATGYTSSTMTGAKGIAVQGPFAYMLSAPNQLTVFNVSNAGATTTVAGFLRDATNLSSPQYITVQGGYAYITATNSFTVVDITNPASPTVAGSIIDSTNLAGAKKIALAGTIAYVTASTNDKVAVIDVSTPSSPHFIGVLTDSTNLDGAVGIAVSGRQAYVSTGPATATSTDGLTILNLNGYDMVGATIGSLNVGSIYTGEGIDVGGQLRVRGGINADGGGIHTSGEITAQGAGTSTIWGKLQTFGGIRVSGGDVFHSPDNVFTTSSATSTALFDLKQVKVVNKTLFATESTLSRFIAMDVSNSAAPLAIANITDTTRLGSAQGFAIAGKYAYVVAPSTDRLTVIDISNVYNPLIVNSVTSTNLSSPQYIKIRGNYAYIIQSAVSSKPQVTIWNIASSTNPVEVRTINDRGNFDATPNAMDIYGNYLYVGGSSSARFTVVDITNPLVATSTGSVGSGAGGQNGLVARGRYVYATRGAGSAPVLRVIDVSVPTAPVASICLSDFNGNNGTSLTIEGNYAYVGLEGGGAVSITGIGIADISQGTTCRDVSARNAGTGNVRDITVVGKQLYAARTNGLTVLSLQGLDAPVANIGSIWGSHLYLDDSMTVFGAASFKNGLNAGHDILTSGIFISQSTSTSLFAGDIQVNGASVCLSNGVNCPTGDLNWSYSLASDVVRNTTSTTDIIIGGTATTSAPVFFSLLGENASSSRLVIGQNQNMDVTIGSATSSGFNSGFQLSGDDLFVQGNIGSATSVYTNGAFIAGTGSTMLGNGFLTAFSGDLTLFAPNGNIILDPRDSGSVQLGGTSADYISLTGRVNTDIIPLADGNYALGSSSLRWKGVDAVSVTSTNATTTNLFTESVNVSSTVTSILRTGSAMSTVTTTAVGSAPNSVAVSGKYAFVTNRTGNSVTILDVSNVDTPRVINTIALSGTNPEGIVVAGKYIYVAESTTGKISVYDISNPASSTFIGNVSITKPHGLFISGKYLYVTQSGTTVRNLAAVDISDPYHLFIAGTSTALNADPFWVSVRQNTAYVWSLATTHTVAILDVTDPSNMQVATTTFFADKIAGSDVQGSYLFGARPNNNALSIIDISNATSPTMIASSASISGSPKFVAVSGRYAYVNRSDGLFTAFDISSSTNPFAVASAPIQTVTGLEVTPVAVSGRYAYVVNSGSNSLTIIDVHGTETNGLIAHSAEVGSLQVRGSGIVDNLFTVAGSLNVGAGGIYSQGSLGVYTNAAGISAVSIFNHASNTASVLDVRGGCDGTSSTAPLIRAGNNTDNTVFKVSCNGYVTADGTYASPATDFAEYLRGSGTVAVQDVLVLDPATSTRRVRRGSTALRNSIIGVYSTKPSFLGGNSEDIQNGSTTDAVPVAMLGQVPTKVNALSQPIQAGDFVMPGDDGYAVKAQGSGMVLGRALENFMSGTGTIDIFVQPVWWAGDILESTSSTNMIVKDLSLQFSNANASSSLVDSPAFVFQGSAWDGGSNSIVSSSFTLLNDVISASSSLFSVKGAVGTNLLTISELGNVGVSGDLTVGHRLFLGSKQGGQASTSTYLFIDDTQAPSSSYIATNADGWSTASTYDYAERFASNEALQPGDVVMADGNGIERVKRTVSSQDVVLGIVSTKPGFITGGNTTGTYPIALAGRVPTRVSTMNGAIAIGDQLAPSTVPGVAVKAVIGGPVIGIALEGYDLPQEGRISVFVQPGWKGGDIVQTPTSTLSYVPAPSTVLISPRSGLAKIFAGATDVSVSFTTLNSFPLISVTPYGLPTAKWGISNVTDHGFTIVLEHPENFDLVMSWKAEPSPQDGVTSLSDGTSASYDSLTGETINGSATSSSDTPTIPDVTSTPPEAPTSSDAVLPPDAGTTTDSGVATSSDPVL